jgi:hypothetical protein
VNVEGIPVTFTREVLWAGRRIIVGGIGGGATLTSWEVHSGSHYIASKGPGHYQHWAISLVVTLVQKVEDLGVRELVLGGQRKTWVNQIWFWE